ncbi:hypothetical protein [Algiphilus sp.]|uniref:hypothetical protein n=1 Tax=Algiphilus sp. TaxID=1872431 RepID=UPI003BAD4524
MDDEIEFRLRGEGIKPGLVRSHELAEIIEAVESFVTAEVLAADDNINKDDIVVGLYQIADKSIGLKFKTTLATVAIPAFLNATSSLAKSDFDALAPQSLKPLRAVSAFARRHNCVAELKIPSVVDSLASITPETDVPEPARIVGNTEIVGKILRVGGKVPRAMIELIDGTVIYCDVAWEVARELGHRLYSQVILVGSAVWDARTVELQDFNIQSFKEFPKKDPLEVLGQLRSEVGSVFDHVGDVPSFVSRLRQNGELQ